jgi:uncharacterized membrane protein YjjP (DUF1212 family)
MRPRARTIRQAAHVGCGLLDPIRACEDAPMVEGSVVATTSTPEPDDATIVRLALRVGSVMLASGAQTQDVETAVASVGEGLGLEDVSAVVTFSTITISYVRPGRGPATLLHPVRDREADFARLASASTIARELAARRMDVDRAWEELAELDAAKAPHVRAIVAVAPAVSAGATTLLFGGTLLDAAFTLAIALLIQPVLAAIDRSELPSFFRTAVGAFASTIATAALVGIGLPINGGLILTASLLRFLPGYALVSGFRDLLDQSIISGTARVAEAILLGAAVAGGVAAGLATGGMFGVQLSIVSSGSADWHVVVSLFAAFVAVGAYAVRLGVPSSLVAQSGVLGALAWVPFQLIAFPAGPIDRMLAMFAFTVGIGMIGRVLARRFHAPSSLWVVPAVLPFLPGLQIVTALLAESDLERLVGLLGAAGTAFVIGTGVASGDVIIATLRRLRERVIPGAIEAAVGGVDAMVIVPFEQIIGGRKSRDAAASMSTGDEDQPEPGPGP